jgi:type IV pilus assembly protein PilV
MKPNASTNERNPRRKGRPPLPGRTVGRRGGFTLIELLVAVVVLAVGILGVSGMQVASLSSSLLSRNYGSCSSLVSDALDRIYANHENFADYVGAGGAFVVSPEDGYSAPGGVAAAADYDALYNAMVNMEFQKATLTVTIVADTPVTGVNAVVATITWDHKGGMQQCSAQSVMPPR